MKPYKEGSVDQCNTGDACWSCRGLTNREPGEKCIYASSHRPGPSPEELTQEVRTTYQVRDLINDQVFTDSGRDREDLTSVEMAEVRVANSVEWHRQYAGGKRTPADYQIERIIAITRYEWEKVE